MASFTGKVRIGTGVSAKEGVKRMSGTEVPMKQAKITTSKSAAIPKIR
jgi:hypothetical protein